VHQRLTLQVPLKTPTDIEDAVKLFTDVVQWAGWTATPPSLAKPQHFGCPIAIKQKLAEKRKLRRDWQRLRTPESKRLLNAATRDLKQRLRQFRNDRVQHFLQGLQPTASTDYSLWKATRHLKHVTLPSPPLRTPLNTWVSSPLDKAQAFATHLAAVFQPHPSFNPPGGDDPIEHLLASPYQLEPPAPPISRTEVQTLITSLNPKKSAGYDLITGPILQALPPVGIQFITQLFNAALLQGYFPAQWKVAQIILLPKPGKPPHELTSYRPISLLPLVSKLFEKILLNRILPHVDSNRLLPAHQFGFRKRHSTIDQTHRVVHRIHAALEHKQYCSAAFIDISQAFDKVWHPGLLYKLRRTLPLPYFLILQSYLHHRHFLVKVANAISDLTSINAGVPQGSVLGPLLYILYTADFPSSPDTLTATFADDTVILTTASDPTEASHLLQADLLAVQTWLHKWRLKANATKSVHVTFTLRRATCPPVHLNDVQLPQSDDVKYLGLHLDRRLTWRRHIFAKRKQLGLTLAKMNWLLGRRSHLSLTNKLLLYKMILKPIWTYGIQLWGTASTSNIEILERFQAKALRMMVDAPWYVPNTLIRRDLNISTVKEEISRYSSHYGARLRTHPNPLIVTLLGLPDDRRLQRRLPNDLPYRFLL
jgi:hypothetical protein